MNFETFIEDFSSEPAKGILELCNEFFIFDENSVLNNMSQSDRFDIYIEYFTLLEAFLESNGYTIPSPPFNGNDSTYINTVKAYINDVRNKIRYIEMENTIIEKRNKYKTKLGLTFHYKFTDGDLARIQTLINELRDYIQASELFTDEHKARLLARLEKLQKELHKKMSSLDKFWGLIGDAGVALGKFGEDVKPLVDRIKEISNIVWRTQAIAEELPTSTPMMLLDSDVSVISPIESTTQEPSTKTA